jgi:transketolase
MLNLNKKSNPDSELERLAKSFRKDIFEFKTNSGFGHLASSLSCVEILVSLFFDSESNFDLEHDRVIFGKGHGSPAIYPMLAELGYFSRDELKNYCKPNGILRMHADYSIPGCNFVGGSLGNGIGFAAGLAVARPWQKFIVILGDAELYEGSVWESLLFISHHKLKNLTLIVDRNKFGILGNTEIGLKLEPLVDKFESFGFQTYRINGHNFRELRECFSIEPDNPKMIIADTIKGKGISYMEDKFEYHTIIPSSKDDIELGIRELS